jgi:hypothetical protein
MIESERAILSRTLRTLTEQFDGAALSKRLNDFGFCELLAEAPREAVSALFGGLGRAGSMCTALQAVLRQPLAGILSEEIADVDVALPWIGSDLVGDGDDDTLAIRGLVIGHTAGAACLAPVAIRGELVWVHLADDATLNSRTVIGLDPELAMTEITGVTAPADVVVAGGSATAVWAAVCSAGRLALGYQILGAVDQMIDLAVEHARSRVQFGIDSPTHTSPVRAPPLRSSRRGASMTPSSQVCWPSRWRGGRRESPRPNVSRCWPASASPPNIRSTASWPARSCSIRYWVQRPNCPEPLAPT